MLRRLIGHWQHFFRQARKLSLKFYLLAHGGMPRTIISCTCSRILVDISVQPIDFTGRYFGSPCERFYDFCCINVLVNINYKFWHHAVSRLNKYITSWFSCIQASRARMTYADSYLIHPVESELIPGFANSVSLCAKAWARLGLVNNLLFLNVCSQWVLSCCRR